LKIWGTRYVNALGTASGTMTSTNFVSVGILTKIRLKGTQMALVNKTSLLE
jgi:hypothetical protein